MLKAELGYSLQSGVAVAQDTELNLLLSNMQKWIWAQYQWPFLYTHEDIAITATTRFYPQLSVVSLDYPTKAETKWGLLWYDVDYGISGEQYEQVDPDRQETLDPIFRWQLVTSTSPPTIEVWPVPTSNQTLRFWGTKSLSALASDSDTADLDDLLIVLFTAAEKLSRMKLRDAEAKLNKAQALFHRLRGADRPLMQFPLSGGTEQRRRDQKVVSIVGNPNH